MPSALLTLFSLRFGSEMPILQPGLSQAGFLLLWKLAPGGSGPGRRKAQRNFCGFLIAVSTTDQPGKFLHFILFLSLRGLMKQK